MPVNEDGENLPSFCLPAGEWTPSGGLYSPAKNNESKILTVNNAFSFYKQYLELVHLGNTAMLFKKEGE